MMKLSRACDASGGIAWFGRFRLLCYYISVFLASFLFFVLEPMLSKALLPVFGGSYLVWGAGMVFFQAVLLLGYAFVHFFVSRAGIRAYIWPHIMLLAAAYLNFPFRPYEHSASGSLPLFLEVFRLLAYSAGLPFMALATISVITQKFYSVSGSGRGRNPYILYGISNIGAMSGLFAYPFVIEPFSSFGMQGVLWWVAYSVMAAVSLFCLPFGRSGDVLDAQGGDPLVCGSAKTGFMRKVQWFSLSFSGCFALLAVTNLLTMDVASVPLLWALPLAVYMLSFVLVFREKAWFPGWIGDMFGWLTGVALVLLIMIRFRLEVPVPLMTMLWLAILFCLCLYCHGTLVSIKPSDPAGLTSFYLYMGAGGFGGGIFAAWIVPVLTSWVIEPFVSLALAYFAVGFAGCSTGIPCLDHLRMFKKFSRSIILAVSGACLVMAVMVVMPRFIIAADGSGGKTVFVLTACLAFLFLRSAAGNTFKLGSAILVVTAGMILMPEPFVSGAGGVVAVKRNYYGVYRVFDTGGIRYIQHGTTMHGKQYLDPALAGIPLSYHAATGPMGGWLLEHPAEKAGMIGLGSGALACYFQGGRGITIYEIDPDCVEIAERYFSYLETARRNGAEVDIVIGDGRLALRGEPNAKYDVFILDAFNSGSVPAHLLTCEAMAAYMRVLKPDGLVFLHISNRHLNLAPMVQSVASAMRLHAVVKSGPEPVVDGADVSEWVAVTSSGDRLAELESAGWTVPVRDPDDLPRPWTDDYSNLPSILRLRFL